MKNKYSDYDSVTQAIIHLFSTEMFFAEIIASMKRINSPKVPLAGVCIKEHIELHINMPVFAGFPLEQRAAFLKHECEHILRNHISRMRELMPDVYSEGNKDIAENIINSMKHKVANIAADCAINPGIAGMPYAPFCFPKKFKLQDGETMEWYLEKLKENQQAQSMKQRGKPGESGEEDLEGFDGHEIWNESEGSKEVLKEKIKQAINKAAENTRAAGKMTAEHELTVQGLNKASVCWKEQLRRFVARTIETTLEDSRKKRNRRYGIHIPGTVKIERLHLGVAIDTSGSMSDQALEQAMAEIGEIAKYAKVTVVEADTSIKNEYTYTKGKKYTVKGRGGTAYQPALTHFNDHKIPVDALIYIGDMDNYDQETLIKPKYPVLWAIVGDQAPPATWGSQIKVLVNENR